MNQLSESHLAKQLADHFLTSEVNTATNQILLSVFRNHSFENVAEIVPYAVHDFLEENWNTIFLKFRHQLHQTMLAKFYVELRPTRSLVFVKELSFEISEELVEEFKINGFKQCMENMMAGCLIGKLSQKRTVILPN